ncbi:tRNA (adenosine(37)-N6)-threonylcarbamoyltransferase complex dimerization subunit type 1 TsaB [Akkermansia sp. N21169]|uniref:tRNA (adenosine(37)-N6)-threonylcarbamoyltransferase complex dimerization subunit type 1 TsaB n=1 Tax=Akkermansia sp. N21169 TaxID=3040765 RepID=UPI00244E62BF|nr:tRNA (adenosine(37)-N6)-threonylcarbamoyltransferase complex dimerization subunit type 1 TsaB [Akkermansia sp. N21169]MDH3069915.1 tRNA (adenosine(37)-N6)-threonylcarbamoyltransferase complex dimerization subunit type 1 TsaB [Akkermansia sp. N21169]
MEGDLLTIETSGSHASMALWKGGQFSGERSWTAERHHSSSIFPHLKTLLGMPGELRISTIVVGAGPGSYGGIRVALAAADGISLIHGSRVVSLCSWEAIPAEGKSDYRVISDARRNGWAVATFRNRRLQGEIAIMDTEELKLALPGWRSQGETVYSPEDPDVTATLDFPDSSSAQIPSARILGEAWFNRNDQERVALLEHAPAPIYVRPPHITAAKRPAWATRQ